MDKIVVEKEDLETPGDATGTNKIIIGREDLETPGEPEPEKIYPGLGQSTGPGAVNAGNMLVSSRNVVQYLVAGLVGGIVAWLLTEIFWGDGERGRAPGNVSSMLVSMGFFGSVLGCFIGGAVSASEGITASSPRKAMQDGLVGLGIGFLFGFLGGVIAQFIYSSMRGGLVAATGSMLRQIMARTIGWAIVGSFVGLSIGVAQGIVSRSRKKMLNGIIGGLVGGYLGGFLFDPIGQLVGGGTVSRFIAIPVIGVAVGLAIGMVEELRKSAWLEIVTGPMAGKQFILYKQATSVGKAYDNDIPILKDPDLLPRHAIIRSTLSGATIDCLPGAMLAINGRQTSRQRLRNGDKVGVGSTVLLYREKGGAVP